jgi:L-seryl-tRNA(Ser) seleniumtransferase
MLSATVDSLAERARGLQQRLADASNLRIEVAGDRAPVGGGSLPGAELPTVVLRVEHRELTAGEFARRLRLGAVRLVSRVQADRVVIDLRSVLPSEDELIVQALRAASG